MNPAAATFAVSWVVGALVAIALLVAIAVGAELIRRYGRL